MQVETIKKSTNGTNNISLLYLILLNTSILINHIKKPTLFNSSETLQRLNIENQNTYTNKILQLMINISLKKQAIYFSIQYTKTAAHIYIPSVYKIHFIGLPF
jgi:hypothetical protein